MRFLCLLLVASCGYEPCGGLDYEYLSKKTGVCITETNQEFHDNGWTYLDIDLAVDVAINAFLSYHYVEDKALVIENLSLSGARMQFFDTLHRGGREVMGLTSWTTIAVSTHGSETSDGAYEPLMVWNSSVHHEVLHLLDNLYQEDVPRAKRRDDYSEGHSGERLFIQYQNLCDPTARKHTAEYQAGKALCDYYGVSRVMENSYTPTDCWDENFSDPYIITRESREPGWCEEFYEERFCDEHNTPNGDC